MGTTQVGGECRHGIEQWWTERVLGLPALGFEGRVLSGRWTCPLHQEVRAGRRDATLPEVDGVAALRRLWAEAEPVRVARTPEGETLPVALAGPLDTIEVLHERRPVIERIAARLVAEAEAPVDDTLVRHSQNAGPLPGQSLLATLAEMDSERLFGQVSDEWLAEALLVERQGVANGAWMQAAVDMMQSDGWDFDLNLVSDTLDPRFEWETLDEPGRNAEWVDNEMDPYWDDSYVDGLEVWQEELLGMLMEIDG